MISCIYVQIYVYIYIFYLGDIITQMIGEHVDMALPNKHTITFGNKAATRRSRYCHEKPTFSINIEKYHLNGELCRVSIANLDDHKVLSCQLFRKAS